MKTSDVISYFDSQHGVARALGISQPSVANWGEYPPDGKQLLIERLTQGALRAEPGCLDRLIGADRIPTSA